MRRSRYLAMALLALSLSACDAAQAFAPASDRVADSAVPAGTTLSFSHDNGNGGGNPNGGPLFDELAEKIPGFGGLYRSGECAVTVVLTDMSEAQKAINIVHAALAPIHPCHGQVQVSAVQGQFTYIELQRFLAASRPLLELRGVYDISISYQLNRLVITVASRAVAGAVLEALDRLGIPAAAVVFNVRGGGVTRPTPTRPAPTRPAPTRPRG